MKNKIITNDHLDYINNIVIIIGFNNLGDFDKIITYEKLKMSCDKICSDINETFDQFKKVFPQHDFHLRKYNYTLKNIDQVIGFIKKVFLYLNIPWCYNRIKGMYKLRLIPPNNIYNKYIINLRENPQNVTKISEKTVFGPWHNSTIIQDNVTQNSNIESQIINNDKKEEMDSIEFTNFTDILKYKKKDFTSTYLMESSYLFNNVNNVFEYISFIKLSEFKNGTTSRLKIGTNLTLEIGGVCYINKTITEESEFKDNYYTIPIDFPNNAFYKYHDIRLCIKRVKDSESNHKLVISGSTFNSKLPKHYKECNIKFNHDLKWYELNEFTVCSYNSMILTHYTKSYLKKEKEKNNSDLNKIIEFDKKNKIKIEKIDGLTCLNIMNEPDDKIPNLYFGVTCLTDKMIIEKYDNYNAVIINQYEKLHVSFTKVNSNSTISMHYGIPMMCDFIKHIELLKNDINIEYELKYQDDVLSKSDLNNKYLNLINKQYNIVFIMIEVPEIEYEKFNELHVCFKCVYSSQEHRKKLSIMSTPNDIFI